MLSYTAEFVQQQTSQICSIRWGVMKTRNLVLIGTAVFSIGIRAVAGGTDATVVSVHYSVRENDPEKLEKIVSNPVERRMRKLDRVVKISSATSHGVVDVEVGFEANATNQDLAAVATQIEMLRFDEDVVVLSRVIELRPARLLAKP